MNKLKVAAISLLLLNAVISGYLQATWSSLEQQTAKVKTFPQQLGDWQGRDLTLTPREIQLLRTSDVVFRFYRRGNETIQFLATWAANDLEALHPSDDCYTASGWEICGWKLETLRIPKYGQIDVLIKEVRKGQSNHLFFDLFRTADGWSPQVWSHLWQLVKRTVFDRDPSGGKIRLDTVQGKGGRPAALRRITAFMALLLPQLEKCMR